MYRKFFKGLKIVLYIKTVFIYVLFLLLLCQKNLDPYNVSINIQMPKSYPIFIDQK